MTLPFILIIPAVLAVILAAVLTAEIHRELHTFCVTRYEVSSEKLPDGADVKILFLSDLHDCCYGENNDRLFQAVKEEHPDLILVGGDMLVGKKGCAYENALALLKRLPSVCPVVYANGNHEQRMKEAPEIYDSSYDDYKSELLDCGITLLENESIRIPMPDGTVFAVHGLELPVSTYLKFRKAPVKKRDLERRLGSPQADAYNILLAHNPAYMDACKDWGADLILSGHLHGGLVRIPGIGGIITPQGFLFPKYCGEMRREGNQTVIVSRGLGSHTLNIRLFNIPEVVSIRIRMKTKKSL